MTAGPAPRVRIVHLPGRVFDALAAGDLTAADAASPIRLGDGFAGADRRHVWRMRSEQVCRDPEQAAWVTGVLWDEDRELTVGRPASPGATGMVEVGYALDPAHRRRGFARAALEVLLQRAREDAAVRTVLATIAPAKPASAGLVRQYGSTAVGEQEDDEDSQAPTTANPASTPATRHSLRPTPPLSSPSVQ